MIPIKHLHTCYGQTIGEDTQVAYPVAGGMKVARVAEIQCTCAAWAEADGDYRLVLDDGAVVDAESVVVTDGFCRNPVGGGIVTIATRGRTAVPVTEGSVVKGGQNPPDPGTDRPPAPQGSGMVQPEGTSWSGQYVVALLAGVALEEVFAVMGYGRNYPPHMRKALKHFGLDMAEHSTPGNLNAPGGVGVAFIMGQKQHWLAYNRGLWYDPLLAETAPQLGLRYTGCCINLYVVNHAVGGKQ